ncbi:MAG TPA: aminotransferase class IV, partial [Nitrospiraceae bacterium]|nr:aminotransferase class IV [Nitrospiraceae bacterium]
NPFTIPQWNGYIQEGIRLAGYDDSKVYLQVTRGVAPRDHIFPPGTAATAVMTIREMRPLDPAIQTAGVGVIMLADFRWGRCDIKSLNLLPNVMARQRAKKAGAYEAIFVRHDLITEGAVSNVMVVREEMVMTPPESSSILSGVTRRVVLDLAKEEGFFVREQDITREEFQTAEEIFLTGTTMEVMPVVSADGVPISNGRRGRVTERLSARFRGMTG